MLGRASAFSSITYFFMYIFYEYDLWIPALLKGLAFDITSVYSDAGIVTELASVSPF